MSYTEELVKPLRDLLESQHKARNTVENTVDKTAKNLAEWRSAEAKAKKLSYQCARENERAEDQALEARLARHSGRKEAAKVGALVQWPHTWAAELGGGELGLLVLSHFFLFRVNIKTSLLIKAYLTL